MMASATGTLAETLQSWFGYGFREGQEQVVQAVLAGRDATVYWPTGFGKSLCYQLPAMHSKRQVFVVSPLISLMQDQVIQLNALLGSESSEPVAGFLGSAQNDPDVERRALDGSLLFVFVTPEKATQDGFLSALSALHRRKPLGLFAIDEAHCVSEWGNDFRPSYRELGVLRMTIPNVPILALTATSRAQVRKDITDSLHLRDPLVSTRSVDRANLSLHVKMRASGGLTSIYADIFTTIQDNNQAGGQLASTIVYAPTREKVEKISQLLKAKFGENLVEAYHAGLPTQVRDAVHRRFLTGQIAVVVATVAFGMGINKPDIRKVVHIGGCKTMEEYYQQVGRAGRDGLPAICTMFCSMNELSNYNDDFYTKHLTNTQKSSYLASVAEMSRFANASPITCRREFIKHYFGEQARLPTSESTSAPTNCGSCDNCLVMAREPETLALRDYSRDASVVLIAVLGSGGYFGWNGIKSIISGSSKVHGHAQVMREVKLMQSFPGAPKRSLGFYENLLAPLVNAGFIGTVLRQAQNRTYTAYMAQQRTKVLDFSCPARPPNIKLPPSESELDAERKQQEKIVDTRSKLKIAGVEESRVPPEEWKAGSGPVIDTYLFWIRTCAARGEDYTKRRTNLLDLIRGWRAATAQAFSMAPASILAEHTMIKIAYSLPSQFESLRQIGARVDTASLLSIIQRWKEENLVELDVGENADCKKRARDQDSDSAYATIVFPPGNVKGDKWAFALKGSRTTVWEESLERFNRGDLIETVATDRKKPIASRTVLSHLLKALTFGMSVDLARAATEMPSFFPNKSDAGKIELALGLAGYMDLVKFPTVMTKDVLRGLDLGHNVDNADKSPDERAAEAAWYAKIDVYISLKRASINLNFESCKVPKTK